MKMTNPFSIGLLCACLFTRLYGQDAAPAASCSLLSEQPDGVTLWWALSSVAKIHPDQAPPTARNPAILLSSARNEREAVQLVVRPTRQLEKFQIICGDLAGKNGALISSWKRHLALVAPYWDTVLTGTNLVSIRIRPLGC